MILPLGGAATAWEHVVQAGSGGGGGRPVLVFAAAPDPDALAAVRTVTALLRADLVQYEVHPVSGYAQLRDSFRLLAGVGGGEGDGGAGGGGGGGGGGVDPRAVVCVNCGAGVDLGAVLGLSAAGDGGGGGGGGSDQEDGDGVKVFVFDSHRPYHLRNVNSDRVFVFDDSPQPFDTTSLPFDLGWEDEWGNVADVESDEDDDEDDSSSGGSGSEDDVDGDADDTGTGSEADGDGDGDGDGDDTDDEEDDVKFDDAASAAGRRARKRKRRQRREGRRRRQRRRRPKPDAAELEERRVLREYYAAAPAGMASACLAHNLAALLRRESNETLWAAIVGVTHQYLAAKVGAEGYEDAVEYCRHQALALAPKAEARRGGAGGGRHGAEDGPVASAGYGPTAGGEASGAAQAIMPSAEFRLDLVRHWTLHESLMCSSYTLTRLAAWRQTGKRRLQELLATLGIPLAESKQQWCYMKAECKAALDDRLARSVRRFDLGKDIQYDSFVRVLPGHRGKISAADAVFGLSALLELDGADAAAAEDGTLRERFVGGGAAAAAAAAAEPADSGMRFALERRFWRAYDAMDAQRSADMAAGLQLAIMAQKLAASVGGAVLEHKQFHSSGPFRYVFLRDYHCKELFAHPLLLRRLALFLIEALVRQGVRDKPFIVLAPDAGRAVWLTVAAMTAGGRNEFGQHFRRAAAKNGSQVTFDGFEASACEIPDGQETDFIRYLHDVML